MDLVQDSKATFTFMNLTPFYTDICDLTDYGGLTLLLVRHDLIIGMTRRDCLHSTVTRVLTRGFNSL